MKRLTGKLITEIREGWSVENRQKNETREEREKETKKKRQRTGELRERKMTLTFSTVLVVN